MVLVRMLFGTARVVIMGALLGGRQLHFQAVRKALDVVEHACLVVPLLQHQRRPLVVALALRLCRRVERRSPHQPDIFAFLVHIILCSDFWQATLVFFAGQATHRAQRLHHGATLNGALHHLEKHVRVDFLVEAELAGLAERPLASGKVARKWFLTCVDEHVLLEILVEGERLEADAAGVLFDGHVGGHVAAEREAGGVGLLAALFRARIGSFHLVTIFEDQFLV
jgi:hypothetical protein